MGFFTFKVILLLISDIIKFYFYPLIISKYKACEKYVQ